MAAVGAAAHMLAISRVAPWAGGSTLPLNLRSMAVALVINLMLLGAHGGPAWPEGGIGWGGFAGPMLFFTPGVPPLYPAVARLGPVRSALLLPPQQLVPAPPPPHPP